MTTPTIIVQHPEQSLLDKIQGLRQGKSQIFSVQELAILRDWDPDTWLWLDQFPRNYLGPDGNVRS